MKKKNTILYIVVGVTGWLFFYIARKIGIHHDYHKLALFIIISQMIVQFLFHKIYDFFENKK